LNSHVQSEQHIFSRIAPDAPETIFSELAQSFVVDDGTMLFNNPFEAHVQPLDVWDDAFFEEEGNRDFLNNTMRYLADGEAWSGNDSEEIVTESSDCSGFATPVEELAEEIFRPFLFELDALAFSNSFGVAV